MAADIVTDAVGPSVEARSLYVVGFFLADCPLNDHVYVYLSSSAFVSF